MLQAFEFTSRELNDYLVLDTVSLTVPAGEIYCLLGAAGSGKTALLQAFLGLTKPSSGRVDVAGINATEYPLRARRSITFIPRGASLYGSLTPAQNVDFFVRLGESRRVPSRQDCLNAMRRVGMPEREFDVPVQRLSRAVPLFLWLAIGLLKNTPILILDEPTVGLALDASADFQDTLLAFRQQGKALLIASSDILLAARVGDRIGIMKDGRKTVEFSKEQLIARPLQERWRSLIPAMPSIPASGDCRRGGCYSRRMPWPRICGAAWSAAARQGRSRN